MHSLLKIASILDSIGKYKLSDKLTKIAIDPVWWLPGIAKRFNITT